MNPRVLELLKNPKNIQSEDLGLLKEEISSFPYIQNIRALHLYGIHLYDKENYQRELSVTAAYTTDKKILYQLINGKAQPQPKPEIVERKEEISEPVREKENLPAEEPVIEDKKSSEKRFEEAACLMAKPQPEVKHIYVNGERNRILFEGEENFLEDDNRETIDLESTFESGIIVTQKQEKAEEISLQESVEPLKEDSSEEKQAPEKPLEGHSFTPETIIEEEKISSKEEKEEITDPAELSFHETESFLPEVTVQANKEEIKENPEEKKKQEGVADFTPEKIINEEEISSEQEKRSVRDDEELSFHGLESFLPGVTIQSTPSAETAKHDVSRPSVNKHEEEMRRLIEEVEKKMKAKKGTSPEKEKAEPEIQSHDINFAETQSFEVISEQKTEIKDEVKESQPENIKPETSPNAQSAVQESHVVEAKEEIKTTWKPMNFESNVPDSLINKPKPVEIAAPEVEAVIEPPKQKSILPLLENIPELIEDQSEKFEKNTEELKEDKEAPKMENEDRKREEVPVMNVSFFSSNWAINEPQKEQKEEPEKEVKETPKQDAKTSVMEDSNVPGFINTWQNWLKIDRSQEIEKTKVENKIKAIDSFIENNPKITQLKDESSYVVKERTDDISHLMTETLAKLYFEQKLYTKAINAFQILAGKHPEKRDYFEAKIQEIKDIRGKN
ncbi:hypothetical protein CHRYSEOSP005_19000 [Chryseobacterium sp. Alg-005]|uniref:hypothetical protein n=1 Tax=Chryseobacterium sp. Alg-005 TaxID=3159516 RepID=UPI003555B180